MQVTKSKAYRTYIAGGPAEVAASHIQKESLTDIEVPMHMLVRECAGVARRCYRRLHRGQGGGKS
jgi:hypothetical protein